MQEQASPHSFGRRPRNFAAATPQTDEDAIASLREIGRPPLQASYTYTRRARQRAINRKKSRISTSTSSRHNYCQQNTTQTPTYSRSFPFLVLFLFELSLTEQQQQQQQQQSSPNTNNPHSLNTYFPDNAFFHLLRPRGVTLLLCCRLPGLQLWFNQVRWRHLPIPS
jgi:hypothetical protein